MTWSRTTERLEKKIQEVTGQNVWVYPATIKNRGLWVAINADGGGCKYFNYIAEILPWFEMRQMFVERGWLEPNALREDCDPAAS
jgi:hypothetical protein